MDNVIEWEQGRLLKECGGITYKYDSEGIRTEKSENGRVHKYYTENGNVQYETITQNGVTKKLWYYYDGSGIAGLEYNGEAYYYQKNLQGDVVRIFDGNGELVARYVYDAWGNHKVYTANGTESSSESFIGNINPIRYRGYYYDDDTGLYYLQSRYYDPETGRFINADDVRVVLEEYAKTLNGLNLYAYCLNIPVLNLDPTGKSISGLFVGALLAGLVAGIFGVISTIKSGGGFLEAIGSFVGRFITGFAIGFAALLGAGLATGVISMTIGHIVVSVLYSTLGTFALGFSSYSIESLIKGKEFRIEDALTQGSVTLFAGITNFGLGYVMGGLGLWDSLKKGQRLIDTIKSSKDFFIMEAGYTGIKNILGGVFNYLGMNIGPMIIRGIVKYIVTKPYNDMLSQI